MRKVPKRSYSHPVERRPYCIAEDVATLRNLAKSVLSGLGYKVLLARNGEEAVKLYMSNREKIDLVFWIV